MTQNPYDSNGQQPNGQSAYGSQPAAPGHPTEHSHPVQGSDGRQPAASQPATGGDPYAPAGGTPYAGGTHYGTQTYAPQQSSPQPGSSGSTFFKALFDLKFDHFIADKCTSIIYVLHVIACALLWLVLIVFGIMIGFATGFSMFGESTFNATPLVLAILFGWIPALLQLIYGRMILEFIIASVKTAEHTRTISENTAALRQR